VARASFGQHARPQLKHSPLYNALTPRSIVELPATLRPTATEDLILPSGRRVAVAKSTPTFVPWSGTVPADTHGGKPLVDFDGRPAFAELAILWSLIAAGWDGVWIDSYRNMLRRGYWDSPPLLALPQPYQDRLDRIIASAGRRGGAWDVFAWRGPLSDVAFASLIYGGVMDAHPGLTICLCHGIN